MNHTRHCSDTQSTYKEHQRLFFFVSPSTPPALDLNKSGRPSSLSCETVRVRNSWKNLRHGLAKRLYDSNTSLKGGKEKKEAFPPRWGS